MGQTIEFDRVAFNLTEELEGFPQKQNKDIHLALVKTGASNSFDQDGNIAKSWSEAGIGTKDEIMDNLTSTIGDIQSGYLRYQTGPTKIENYLKNWRKTLNDPGLLGDFIFNHPGSKLIIYRIEDPDDVYHEDWKYINKVAENWDVIDEQYKISMSDKSLITYYKLYDRTSSGIHAPAN